MGNSAWEGGPAGARSRRGRKMTWRLPWLWLLVIGLAPAEGAPGPLLSIHRDYPLDPAIAPCDDFYGHVCSKVVAGMELLPDQPAYLFSAMDAQARIAGAYQDYLEDLLRRPPTDAHERLLKPFFQACMDPAAGAADERRLVAEELATMAGIHSREAFQTLMGQRVDSGKTGFLMLEILANQDDPDRQDIVISSSMGALPDHSYYRDPAVMADFRALAERFYRTLGLDRAAQRADWLIAFEQGFADTFPSPKELRKIELDRRRISREELLRRYPALALGGLLARLPADAVIRDLTPANYAYLERVLEQDPLEELRSIYLFHALSPYMDDAYPDYLKAKLTFAGKHLGAAPQRLDRAQRCRDLVSGLFDLELDAELQPRLFPHFPRTKVEDLVRRVRQAAIDTLRANAWLSPEGRAGALDKLEHMRLQLIGPSSPQEWDFVLPASYRPDHPVANRILFWGKHYERLEGRLDRPYDWRLWREGPLNVDAMYTASENRLVLFQGILQPPYFRADAPLYANLGSLGSMIGHELGHAIDDKGVHFDARGRLHTWMGAADSAGFRQRAERLRRELVHAGQNSDLQLAERIGDIVGLGFAYRAAWPLMKDSRAKQQEFFRQFARNWCILMRPGYLDMMTRTDPHPLGAARVNDTLRQTSGFQQAFGCAPTVPMVLPPRQRVEIW
jgi:putative endopeptidase